MDNINYNVNLHPSFFEDRLPPQPEKRTIDSVLFSRSIPIDLKVTPRKNFNLYSEKDNVAVELEEDKDFSFDAINGILSDSKLSRAFFSRRNMSHLQELIRTKVFLDSGGLFDTRGAPMKDTGHIVGLQSDTQMLIFMRYIYLSFCTFPVNCSDKVVYGEVNRLDTLVLIETVPNILEHAEAHLAFLRDASRLPDPIARSLATSNAGTRQHRSITEILGAEF